MAITREELADYLGTKTRGGRAPRKPWAEHMAFLEDHWQAGQHCSIFAATDGGKTHLWRRLLPLWQRYPVLVIQNKPKDSTAAGLGRQVRAYPGMGERVKYEIRRRAQPDSEAWARDPEWFVLALPRYRWTPDKGKRGGDKSYDRARRIAGEAMDRAYQEGTWVVVFDEVKGLAGREEPHLNLPAPMVNMWERGRSQPVTVIAATQSPALAPTAMYDQPRHLYLGRIQDVARQERLAEIGGDTKLIRELLPTLEGREFLYIYMGRESGDPDQMWVVTAPPR